MIFLNKKVILLKLEYSLYIVFINLMWTTIREKSYRSTNNYSTVFTLFIWRLKAVFKLGKTLLRYCLGPWRGRQNVVFTNITPNQE